MNLKEIYTNVVHIEFPSRYALTSTLLRPQEFYESPKFKGVFFTLEEYMDWYASEHANRFTYYDDWSGFNIPGDELQAFYAMFTNSGRDLSLLSKKELRLYFALEKWIGANKNFYMIGTFAGHIGGDVLEHEVSHAFWTLRRRYQKDQYASLYDKRMEPYRDTLLEKLLDMGYHHSVHHDEAVAYLSTSTNAYLKMKFGMDLSRVAPIFRKRFKLELSAASSA